MVQSRTDGEILMGDEYTKQWKDGAKLYLGLADSGLSDLYNHISELEDSDTPSEDVDALMGLITTMQAELTELETLIGKTTPVEAVYDEA
jgi:hypothetical protein